MGSAKKKPLSDGDVRQIFREELERAVADLTQRVKALLELELSRKANSHDWEFLARESTAPSTTRDVRAESAKKFASLVDSGLTAKQVAKLLGVGDSRIRQCLGDRTLFGIRRGHDWVLPRFQFTKTGVVPGIEKVLPKIPKDVYDDPLAVVGWFESVDEDLEDDAGAFTPLEWLKTGRSPEILARLASDL